MKINSGQIQKVALAYMIAWGISPPLSYGTIYRLLFVMSFLIWDFYAISRRTITFFKKQLYLFSFLSVIVFISYLADGMSGITYNLHFILFFLYMPVFDYYYLSDEDVSWLLVFIMILVITWNITTLLGYTKLHNVSRMMAKDFDGAEAFARQGIGGYGHIYFLLLIIPVLEGMLLQRNNRFRVSFNALCLAAFVLSVAVIVKAGYSIALILMTYSVITVLAARCFRSTSLFLAVSIPVLLLILLNMENILNFAMEYAKGTMYQMKIEDMLLSLNDDEAVGTVAGRTERYIRSIRLFFNSPMLGQLSRADIGKHSAILDRFAQFGVVIGSCTLMYFTKAQRYIYRLHINDGIAIAVLVISTAFFSLNNVAASQGVGLFVFYIAAVNAMDYSESDETME